MKLKDQVSALITLVNNQAKEIEKLRNRLDEVEIENKELRRQLSQDSNNSSKPPASDSIFKKGDHPSKAKKGNRNRGGQSGHKGNNLKRFTQVDHRLYHSVKSCPACQSSEPNLLKIRTKQVVDIPIPKMEVTEHVFYSYQCQYCGEFINSPIAKELKKAVQYGSNIKSMVIYLNVYQLIPYKRLTELIGVVYGHKISQGSITNFNRELNGKLAAFIDQIKESLSKSLQVIHSDETGCMVSKALYRIHVYSDKSRTLLQGHANRGKKAMDEIGIIDKTTAIVVHERWTSYFGYEHLPHALCNAHLIRELKSIE